MTNGVAVCDATSLIAFHQVDLLWIIRNLFARIIAPDIVAQEVLPSLGTLPDWIEVHEATVLPDVPRSLDDGERAVIALALSLSADFAVLDDLAGRNAGADFGLTVVGTLGLLVRAKRFGLIVEVRSVMDTMIANGLFTSLILREKILELAGETDW
jgi:predicted nucleic acid-binding protein